MQTRLMFTAFIKIIPNCVAASRFVLGTLALSEIGYPMACGNGNLSGPGTKPFTNKILYPDLKIPVETRLHVMYESFIHQELVRPEGEPPLPKRICNLREEQDLLDSGVSQLSIDSMVGKIIPSLTNL